nr:uncharacterized protein LOC108019994 [Drosophila suzukii]
MDTLGTRLRLRVCLCVFITFVDYAYKNYTSPRSQRRAPATTKGLQTACKNAAFTIRTQRRIALAMPIVPEAGVVGTNERKTGCQLVNRMDFRVRHECNHKCVLSDQLVWPYCVVKVCL